MRLAFLFLVIFALHSTNELSAQTQEDSTAIHNAAIDYIEGWFEGDHQRMQSALHPELIKRIVVTDNKTGRNMIDGMGMSKLVEGTRRGYGKEIPMEKRRKEVLILDILGNAASVKVDAGPWVDYMHIVKFNGEWKILNVLWERK